MRQLRPVETRDSPAISAGNDIIRVIMALAPGATIDEYEVLGLLGAGGMGEVYRARDPVLKREVAIKVLPPFVSKVPGRLMRFAQEAQAAAALNHPNILVIYRFGSYEGAPYLVSELLEGATLRQQFERGPLPVRKTINTGVQIAHGLAAAHDKGIVHRDLKPENLFVTKDARIKILDFGLAKLMERELHEDETTMTHRTDPGTVMGTAGYMSPEQVRGMAVDHRTDIFAFGVILYEMLTGRRAFQRSTAAETMTAILNDDPPGISHIAPAAPLGLQRVVLRCLEKNPEQRFQSASDLAFALEALSESGGLVPSSSGAPTETKRARARMALWIGGAAAAAALATVCYLVLIGRSTGPKLRVMGYTQLTHSGNAGQVVATDGVRIYLLKSIWQPVGQVAVSGGEIENLLKLPPKAYLDDVSPDGATLLYQSYESGNTAVAPLYSLKVLGGSPRYLKSVSSASWSPDGKSILYDEANGDVYRMNADGTSLHKLISPGSATRDFRMSPDGTRVRYFKDDSLWEATFSGANPHELIRGWHPSQQKCCGAWSPDGSIFAFRAAPGAQLWALDERSSLFQKPSGQPIQLTSSPTHWGIPVFSKTGKEIFCTGATRRGELIRLDEKSKQFLPFLDGISADLLSFSKDARTVAYATYPDDILWKSNVDGTGQVQLSDSSIGAESVSMSPDGSQVAFMGSSGSGATRAYVVSSRGDGARLLFPESAGPETGPNWSPDGHKIAFATNVVNDKARPSEIRILDVDNHRVTTLPGSTGKYSPHWSPNGRFIAASTLDNVDMYICELNTNRWTQIYKGMSAYSTWSHDSRFIHTLRFAGEPAVLRIPVKGGAAEVAADLKSVNFTGTFGLWLGLDPTDAPLLLRDVGTSDVYALSLEQK
jgi:Tol biopolymer transport system component